MLKDAGAAIYGSRAANGVINGNHEAGTVGRSYINIQASFQFDGAPDNRLKMMNSKKIAFERGIYEDFPGLNISGQVYQLLRKVDSGIMSREDAETEIER